MRGGFGFANAGGLIRGPGGLFGGAPGFAQRGGGGTGLISLGRLLGGEGIGDIEGAVFTSTFFFRLESNRWRDSLLLIRGSYYF